MIKFLRKHQKKMLAVFMAGLLVIWLGGTALTSMFNVGPERTVVARTALGKITYRDQSSAKFFTDLIDYAGGDWRHPLFRQGSPITLTDWIVLSREAERLGTQPGNASLQRSMMSEGGGAWITQLARQRDVKVDHIVAAHAKMIGIQRAATIAGASALPGEATIRLAARNVLEKVRVNVVVLPARAFLDEEAPVGEEEIISHYNTYRGAQAGVGLDFGYVLPPAVKVEYIKIDRDVIADNLPIADEVLEKQAREYWDQNKLTDPAFLRPVEPEEKDDTLEGDDIDDVEDEEGDDGDEEGDNGDEEGSDADEEGDDGDEEENAEDDSVAADEESEDEPKSPFFETWEQARDAATKVIRRQRADRVADHIAEWTANRLREPWYGAKLKQDGYKTVPDVVMKPNYLERSIAGIPQKYRYPEAVSVVTTDLFSADEARDVPQIGAASKDSPGGRRESIQSLAFFVEGLTPIPDGAGVDRSRYLSLYRPSSYVLKDPDGNGYLFRVVQTRESRIPESVDEVREDVIRDVRSLRAFNDAGRRGEELAERAGGGGLKDAFDRMEDVKKLADKGVVLREPPPFTRLPRYYLRFGVSRPANVSIPQVGQVSADVAERIFDLARADDPITVLKIEEKTLVLVVEWLETVPAREDEYTALREELLTAMTDYLSVQAMREWLNPENVRARNSVEMTR